MARTAGTWDKGDQRAKDNAVKAFHKRVSNRWKEIGRKRWATMSDEDRANFEAKRAYSNKMRAKRRRQLNERLSKNTNFFVPPTISDDEVDDIENFFYGDVF